MERVSGVVLIALVAAACGGGGGEIQGASNGVYSCDATSLRVSFDPSSSVSVTSGDATLATATFTARNVSEDCELVPGAPRTTAQGSPYDSDSLAEGIYRRAEFDCTVAGARFDLHPIFNADIGRNDGSVLLVLDGKRIVVSAVLKNKGDPRASRVYHAPRYCAPA